MFLEKWKNFFRLGKNILEEKHVRGFVAKYLYKNIDAFNDFYNAIHFEAMTENACTM